jgi:hypothetical protein
MLTADGFLWYWSNIFYYLILCSHFIVPELGPSTKFTYASHKAVSEYKEAKAVCCCNNRYSQLSVI